MDTYEKKYNEALKWMRELYPGLHGATKEDAEHYFPELRESEDERIRKWLVDYFSSIKETVWIHRDITCEQILAWLEKQKEPEWSDIDREMLDRIIERGCCELPPRTRALTSDMVQWLQWMKEGRIAPKPAECIEDSVKFEEGFKTGRESGLRDGQKYVLDNAESYGLCKPAEWSEEDEKMLNNIQYLLHTFIYGSAETGMAEYKYQKEIDWLKALSKPTIKWSAEDEKIYNGLVRLLDLLFENDNYLTEVGIDAGVFKRWLKSLRPQPSWKPSEEHLSALLAVFNDPDNIGSQTCQLALTDLYEQLKKL